MNAIKKISSLTKIGKFDSFVQEIEFQYGDSNQNSNIVFGFNGSGKTTISNALSFFGSNMFIGETEKQEIFNDLKIDENSVVDITLEGSASIKYPASVIHDKNIYVFNPNFVTTHIFDGTKGKLKKFQKTSAEITNKEIVAINKEITTLENEKREKENLLSSLDVIFETVRKNNSSRFNALVEGGRLTAPKPMESSLPGDTIENTEIKIQKLQQDYILSKKQVELAADIENLKAIEINEIDISFDLIDHALTKDIKQLSKEVLEQKILEIRNLFDDEAYKQSVQKWYRFGKEILERSKEKGNVYCPICHTDIEGQLNSLLQDYQGFFDVSYEEFIKTINDSVATLDSSLIVITEQEQQVNRFMQIINKYRSVLNDTPPEVFEFNKLQDQLNTLIETLKQKGQNIQLQLSKPEGIEVLFSDYCKFIQSIRDNIKQTIELLETKKLSPDKIKENIRKSFSDLILLQFNEQGKKRGLDQYKEATLRINDIKVNTASGLPYWNNKLAEEIKKIKIESQSIAKYLGLLGIDNFIIDINEDNLLDNIVIKYKNSTTEKNRLKNCLSEGEKTALAFAYFLSKYENEVTDDTDMRSSVIVIDDPISSLDENRLYSTALLINLIFGNVRQLILLSHNFLFLKFFKSCCHKPNCLFLEDNKIGNLPDELKNFETPYYYMFKKMIDFIDTQGESYSEAKLYLPNFTRRVLETFLSFKFSKIVGRAEYRSPGLDEFKDNINDTDLDEATKNELNTHISDIVKISNPHSHGNAHHNQESHYISKAELLIFVGKAILIIDKMDKLHLTCFTARNSTLSDDSSAPKKNKIQAVGFSQP